MNQCYKSEPLSIIDDIPTFSEIDYYVENYQKISADHLEHLNNTGTNPFMAEDQWQEIELSTTELIKKYVVEDNSKILDVGVGLGRLLEPFDNLQRFGMDISAGYLTHAKRKGINVCMSLIDDMPYKEKYFDAVVTTDVLEHVIDLNKSISKILSVLKPGGVLVVRVPFDEDLSPYLNEEYPYDLVHLRTFNESNLRLLFQKIFRLKVEEVVLTGYRGSPLKVGSQVRVYRGLVNRLLRITKLLNDDVFFKLSKMLCKPVEINFVVRNTSDWQG